ncbi:T9SS type A sorting domain-containing protein [candidate division WOR-3 bacterium]|nr:T9SS type A sorting domain-containing protein [candidate division WOR-3 bacterium]
MRHSLIVISFLCCFLLVAQTPNHNAVLIIGDTPESAYLKVEQAIENGDTIIGLWGLIQYKSTKEKGIYNSLWNDTYLLWELLWEEELNAWPDSNIHVLFGDGVDWPTVNTRYQVPLPFEQITDRSAYKGDVKDIFHDLAYGDSTVGISPMGKDDNFFCLTFGHGLIDGGNTGLELMDSTIRDGEFASLIDSIICNKKIFWMQQCGSGGFIDNLEDSITIILTSVDSSQAAWMCDDKDTLGNYIPENEVVNDSTYFHGEFNYHVMNAVRQKKIWPYGDPPSIEADTNNNRGTSMHEAFYYEWWNDSWFRFKQQCIPQFSDIGGIASSTYLEWDDLLPPAIPTGFTYSYKRDTDIEWGIDFIWKDNDEIDISGYNIYRNGGFLDKTYKDTAYIDYDIDNLRGDTVQYGLSAFDLRDRESSEADLSFTIPITISDDSTSTAFNNARRLVSHQLSIYSLYLSNNRVYCIISDDNGETWGTPELVSDSLYTSKVPAGGKARNGKIVAVWFRGNDKLMYSVRDNGVWGNPSQISYPNSQIHTLRNLGIAVKRDTCHIFMYGIWRSDEELRGSRYRTKWLYGKFHINSPSPNWRTIATQSGMKTSSPTITLKNRTPLLAYDKDNEITYTQPVNGVWYKWNISNSSNRFSKKPNIDYSSGYVNLVWVEESSPSSGIPEIECISIVPATDSTLNYDTIPFKETPTDAGEPFVITKQWLYWEEEDTSGKYEIKRSCYDENTFSWDYPEDVSDIYWADALYPQSIYYRPRKGDVVYDYMVIASVWSEGKEPDIGIQERDEQIDGYYRFASSNLGKEISSPYEIQREGYLDYSKTSNPYELVDYHQEELIYKIDEIDPELSYRIKLGLFQRSETKWKERIEVDGTFLGELWVNSGDVAWFESEIPTDNTKDGEITIKVIKETGDYAVCGALYLYEYAGKGIKSVGGPKTSPSEIPDKLYIRSISCGYMKLEIGIPENCKVELRIYDVTGRCVKTAIDGFMDAGIHQINIEGLSAGVYFYNFSSGKKHYSGKILNIR